MAEHIDLRDPIERRLEAIERAIHDLEDMLLVVVERLNRLMAMCHKNHACKAPRPLACL